MEISIGFLVADEEGRVCIRFTDFCLGFTRRLSGGLARLRRGLPANSGADLSAILFTSLWLIYPPSFWRTGGQFSVKMADVKRNTNQSLSVTPMESYRFACDTTSRP
jgi:hypothetical protein